MVKAEAKPDSAQAAEYSFVDLGDSARLALMLTPKGRGPLKTQVQEVLGTLESVLAEQPQPMAVTIQTVFLREPGDQAECERLFAAHYGADQPVTNFVLQRPCCGAALTVEAWAIGGPSVHLERFGPQALAVSYDSVRWVYCAGVKPGNPAGGVYAQTLDGLDRMQAVLAQARSGFEHVVRTWFYLGGITESDSQTTRYKELNRARTDFYRSIAFGRPLLLPGRPAIHYPASTGIGTAGNGVVMSCLTLQTRREDAYLLPLENPQQTPAYAYCRRYSPQSPKFSRAIALLLGDYVTTWVSGTASIVCSESCHLGDIEAQTNQTIDNIERLIASENFTAHGAAGAGARPSDVAKIRVYLKRPQDFARCRAICQRRFGLVPALYAVADVCRPELLVEIEGVAFSRYRPAKTVPEA